MTDEELIARVQEMQAEQVRRNQEARRRALRRSFLALLAGGATGWVLGHAPLWVVVVFLALLFCWVLYETRPGRCDVCRRLTLLPSDDNGMRLCQAHWSNYVLGLLTELRRRAPGPDHP